MAIPSLLFLLVFFVNSDSQNIKIDKNATHVTCVTDNDTAPIYVEALEKLNIDKKNLLIDSNVWNDWHLQNSSTTLNAPVLDKRWEDFVVTAKENRNFSGNVNLSFSVFRAHTVEFLIHTNETSIFYNYPQSYISHDWTHFSVYIKNNSLEIFEKSQLVTSFKNIPSVLEIRSKQSKFWKIHDYQLRVAQNVSTTPTNISVPLSHKSCLVLYVYLCDYCFLEVVNDNFPKQELSVNNNTKNKPYTSQHIKLENVKNISLKRSTNNGSLHGYWAVDIRRCSSSESNYMLYEHTDEKDIECKFLEQQTSTEGTTDEDFSHKEIEFSTEKYNINYTTSSRPDTSNLSKFKDTSATTLANSLTIIGIIVVIIIILVAVGLCCTVLYRTWTKRQRRIANNQGDVENNYSSEEIPLLENKKEKEKTQNSQSDPENKEDIPVDDCHLDEEIIEYIQVVLSRDNEKVSGEFCNEKTDLLAQAIMNFGVTIVENDPEEVIARIWKDTNNSDDNSKTLWQTGTVPLIIKLNDLNREVVESSINLLKIHKKIEHVVLIGKNSEELNLKMEKWDQLKNFSHVINKHKDKEWYTQIIKSFNVSFQGRGNFSLEDLLKLDESVAEFISLQHLIEMARNERLLIGNEITFSELEKDTKEHELKSQFKKNLTVFYGSSSSERSTLLYKLIMECPKMSLVFYINFKNLISILKENPNEDKDVLNTFLNNNNNDPLVSKIKEIMTQNQKMEIFFDGFKKSDTKQYEQIKNYLKQWSGEGIRIWISSQENLHEDLHNFSNVEHVDVGVLNQELKRQNKKHVSEIKKIDIDIDITTCQKMFETLEKRSPDFLKNYGILALKPCLETTEFDVLNLKIQDEESFLKKILDQEQSEVIAENNKPIFVHQKFAEYLACNWLRNNKDKIKMLPLFSKKYYHLRRILDTMMAKDKPLHLAVINQDFNEFQKHLKNNFNDKDEGGRTALHLLCSYGKQYSFQENETCSEEHETTIFIKMVKSFLQVCTNNDEIDDLFFLNYVQYTVRATCLYPLEEILKKKLCDFKEVMDAARDEGWNIDQFYILSAKLGYVTLITEIVKDQPQLVEEKVCGHSLLYYAATGCNSDLNNSAVTRRNAECAKLLIEKNSKGASFLSTVQYSGGNTILHEVSKNKNKNHILIALAIKNDINVNIANDDGETVLHFASAKGALSDVENILVYNEEGKRVLDNSGNNVLHWACKSKKDNTEMINYWINEEFDINCKNHRDQTPLYFACEEGSIENVKCLENRNADFSIVDKSGNTLLHAASKSKQDNPEIIKIILEKDVDLNALNEEGQTALDLARSNGNERIQKILTNREQ